VIDSFGLIPEGSYAFLCGETLRSVVQIHPSLFFSSLGFMPNLWSLPAGERTACGSNPPLAIFSSASYIKQPKFVFSMHKRRIQHLISDMDGVLLDNREPCYFAVKETLRYFNAGGSFFQDDFRRIWGCGIEEFWRKAGIPDYIPFEEIDEVFWRIFPEMPHTTPFEGTGNAIFELSMRSVYFALISAAREQDIHAFFNLPAYDGLTMYDLFAYVHPRCVTGKRDAIAEIMQRTGARPERTAFVDDSPSGLAAAKELGLLTVGMLDGYASEERIRAAKPEHFIRSPAELVDIVKDYL